MCARDLVRGGEEPGDVVAFDQVRTAQQQARGDEGPSPGADGLLGEGGVQRVGEARAGMPRAEGAEEVGRGLAQLVLTLVDLLRQLMERQALRRIEGGALTDEEIERLGLAFKALAERMDELKQAFELEDEDLNLHLGPLGDLM